MSVPAEARALERRLSLAYVGAFAVALLVFAIAMHFAFAYDIRRDQEGRLSGLVASGRAALELKDGVLKVDVDGAALTDPQTEALVWYDRAGRYLQREGNASLPAGPSPGTRSANGFLWRTERVPSGFVAAGVGVRRDAGTLARIDLGLMSGFVCALVAAAFGGRYLAARAIARIVTTMRALRDFTADAAHELRGPLAALQSNADASLRDPSVMSADHRRRLERIDAAARRMARTADDLLLIARAGTPLERELFAIDLGDDVERAVEARSTLAREKGIALTADVVGRNRMYGDPNEIDRVLGNLIDNAVRFTPSGGSVEVRCLSERGGVAVRVRDSGIGIAADDIPHVFERFWRGDPLRDGDAGSGLGLAIVRALVARHGGTVDVTSVVGEGSDFRVWFPARPPKSSVSDYASRPTISRASSRPS